MRLSHFEALQPICPHCRQKDNLFSPLSLINVTKEHKEDIIEGLLLCSNDQCRQHYPIIHGIPIVVTNIKQYLKNNLLMIMASHEFSSVIESVLGDSAGPGSEYNNIKHHISSYGWDHYADKAPADEFDKEMHTISPGGAVSCLNAGLDLLSDTPKTPMLDIGCALGRTTFELAEKYSGLTLGIDVNFWKLRIARQVLTEGIVSFPLKRLGIIYEKHEFEVLFANKEKVDFWACNAMALPFNNESFAFISALNVFDIIPTPRNLLTSIRNVLKPSGYSIISTPYDWSLPVPVENWLGGQNQFHQHEGESEILMRELFATDSTAGLIQNLKLIGEIEHHPWNVRVHKRRTASYDVHILACSKT